MDSDDQANALDHCEALRPAGIEPRGRSRRSALAETGLDQHQAPDLCWHCVRHGVTCVVATRQSQQLRYGKLNIRAAAVVLVFMSGDGQWPRTVMAAFRFAVIGLGSGMLMTTTKTQHGHAASTTRKGVQRDDHGEQDGQRTVSHGWSIPRSLAGVA